MRVRLTDGDTDRRGSRRLGSGDRDCRPPQPQRHQRLQVPDRFGHRAQAGRDCPCGWPIDEQCPHRERRQRRRGGRPARTGRRREIPRVARITAPVHEGFAGGGVFDAAGRLTAIATASTIRGFAVAIPASIAWAAAAQVLTAAHRGAASSALPSNRQPRRRRSARKAASAGCSSSASRRSSPADAAGLMVGDVLLDVDGHPTETPGGPARSAHERRIGRALATRTLRGGAVREVQLTSPNAAGLRDGRPGNRRPSSYARRPRRPGRPASASPRPGCQTGWTSSAKPRR